MTDDLNAIPGDISPYGHKTLARCIGVQPIREGKPPPELLAGMAESYLALLDDQVFLDSVDGDELIDALCMYNDARAEMAKSPDGVRLWLDDERPAPDGWFHVRTVDQAIAVMKACAVKEASLDHDLGDHTTGRERTGYDFCLWMAEHGVWPRQRPTVHSQNPVGRAAMAQLIERHWQAPKDTTPSLDPLAERRAELLADGHAPETVDWLLDGDIGVGKIL